MTNYYCTEKGRSLYAVFGIVFMFVLAIWFFFTKNLVFIALGLFLIAVAASGIYGFVKNEAWNMGVQDGVFSWSYPRPRSNGSINLDSVSRIVVADCGSTLTFTLRNGTVRKLRLVGSGAKFRDYLKESFPSISLEYIEGT